MKTEQMPSMLMDQTVIFGILPMDFHSLILNLSHNPLCVRII